MILVTGCAGFIGSHTCETLLQNGINVIGIDNLNNYYDLSTNGGKLIQETKKKYNNIEHLLTYPNFTFLNQDICNTNAISLYKPSKICHLAAMAGVRYSLENPQLYFKVNVDGFIHLLEEAKKNNITDIVYASSSSVYGLNTKVPFSELDIIEKCNSPYATSKFCMENIAKMYKQLYQMNIIGLRFFTVYGPRGRPDMAPYKFLKAIDNGEKFKKFGDGTTSRDYTYIDDIVSGIINSLDRCCTLKNMVYNLGNSHPITLNEFISTIEDVVGKKGNYDIYPEQQGDVPHTYADITIAKRDLDYQPKTPLKEGLTKMYMWYKG